MKHVLIIENSNSSLNSAITKEAGKKIYKLRGEFTRFGVKNRNERIYTPEGFLPAMHALREEMNTMPIYGELDHPETFDISLQKASHSIDSIDYIQEQNAVFGQIRLLTGFPNGRAASTLVDEGFPLYVSSRAAGVTEGNGKVNIKKLFTYDLVASPGFVTAKMSPMNESYGFSSTGNYRIYDVSDDSKINELFNMNNNDYVTNGQLSDYSNYLAAEIKAKTFQLEKSIKEGRTDKATILEHQASLESMHEAKNYIEEYLNYLTSKIQVIVEKQKEFETKQNRIISHNDYIIENLENSINYQEYIAENLGKSIDYQEYIAESLDNSIGYQEYIAENLGKSIDYQEYIAESLDNSIQYQEYIAENLEHDIEYTKYIAENLDHTMIYSQYIAENLDNSVQVSNAIINKIKAGKINENVDEIDEISLDQYGFNEEDDIIDDDDNETITDVENVDDIQVQEPIDVPHEDTTFVDDTIVTNEPKPIHLDVEVDVNVKSNDNNIDIVNTTDDGDVSDDEVIYDDDFNESELSKSIDTLIHEVKKRTIVENNNLNFLSFLTKDQAKHYFDLTLEQQEQVKLLISEKEVYSANDVLNTINEALSINTETFEDRLIRLQPENVKAVWNNLSESVKKSYISQAKLYSSDVLQIDEQVENFWNTRSFNNNVTSKRLVNHNPLIQEDKLQDEEMKSIMEKFLSI